MEATKTDTVGGWHDSFRITKTEIERDRDQIPRQKHKHKQTHSNG